MSAGYYHFTVGDFAATVLSDGIDWLNRERFLRRFPDVSEQDLRTAFNLIERDFDNASSHYNVLYLQAGIEHILIDAGEGGDLIANMKRGKYPP